MEKNLNMTQGKPMGLLFSFALPLMCGNVFQQLYTVMDTAIVGRGVGLDALAALGTVDWLNWMLLGVAQGFAQGFSVKIAQKYGEGNINELKHIIGQAARLSVYIAVVFTILSQLGLSLFLTMLRVPDELWEMAELYSRILMGGLSAVVFYNFCSAVLRAVGDSKTPLKAMAVASVTNIILDYIAVFHLGWGIAGAAAATVFSQCLSGVICAYKIVRSQELHVGREHLGLEADMQITLLRMGTPVAAKNVIIALGGIAIQTVVNGFGMAFIAGVTATNKLYGLLEIAALSYGYAVTTYVGQNYGASRFNRIKEGMKSAVVLSLATGAVIAAVMILFGRSITMLFISSDSPELMAAAGDTAYFYLCAMSICLPVLHLLYAYQAAIQGMGNMLIPMVSAIMELGVRVGLAVLVALTGYEYGIFGAEVGAWICGAVFLGVNYYIIIKKYI